MSYDEDARVMAPCYDCGRAVQEHPDTVRWGTVLCSTCTRVAFQRKQEVIRYLKQCRPRPSQRTVYGIARSVAPQGGLRDLAALLAASDDDLLAIKMVGRVTLREIRACIPAPVRPVPRHDWAEHAAMVACSEEPAP